MTAAEAEAKASRALKDARIALVARVGADPDANGGWLEDVCDLAADVDKAYSEWSDAYDAMQAERGVKS